MAHNFREADYATGRDAILTISPDDFRLTDEGYFTWRHRLGELGVEVGGHITVLDGEDLYALREFLLNEIPEEAFVRPAEPPYWSDGDLVEYQGVSLFRREGGKWFRIWRSGDDLPGGLIVTTDETFRRRILEHPKYHVVRRATAKQA